MLRSLENAYSFLRGKVNLLIIDDDAVLCKSLSGMFSSPLFNVTSAQTLDEANQVIGALTTKWHCWIVDIDLGFGQSGLELLKRQPQFQFAVVLSGLRSMALGAEAMNSGARAVVDKNPDYIDRMYNEICKTAALGYVLSGNYTPQLGFFLHLQNQSITTVEKWAGAACMPVRHLQRICELHHPLTPRYALALYRTMYYLLWHVPGVMLDDKIRPDFGPDPAQQDLYASSIEYIMRKAEK